MKKSSLPPQIKPRPDPYIHSRHVRHCLDTVLLSDGKLLTLSDSFHVTFLRELDRLVQLIQQSDAPPYTFDEVPAMTLGIRTPFYRVVNGKNLYRVARINPAFPVAENELLELFISALHIFGHSYASCLIYPPHLQLLAEIYATHLISSCLTDTKLHPNRNILDRPEAEVYNEFIATVRHELSARKWLRKELHGWNLGGTENIANLALYLDDRFRQCSGLMVLHLNLFASRQQDYLEHADPDTHKRLVTAVCIMRNRIVDRARKHPSLFRHCHGLVWAIMPGIEMGYYLHLTFLYDTAGLVDSGMLNGTLDTPLALPHLQASERPVVTFPELTGDYLVDLATHGEGRYSLCHRDPLRYRPEEWVTGPVLATDTARRDKLRMALGHLAQRRQLIRFRHEPRGKYFGMAWKKLP